MKNTTKPRTDFALDTKELDIPSVRVSREDTPAELNPETFRLSEDDTDLGVIEEGDGSLSVEVRQPQKGVFVRIHSDPQYRLITGMLTHPKSRESYLVLPEIFHGLDDDLKTPVLLFYGITQDQDLFLWPVKLRGIDYANSAKRAAEHAMKEWVRISQANFRVRTKPAKGDLGQPAWPSLSFDEVLALAFEDRIVRTVDHELMLRFDGMP